MKTIRDYLSAKFLGEIKEKLLSEEKRLSKEKEQLAREDPYLNPERSSSKTAEFVDGAGEDMGHERVEVEKGLLEKLLADTRSALGRMKIGKYGICENCKGWIDRARLEVFPQARYCFDCEKKFSK